ncbi:uncharacterized protein [Triticum aestivum]|uniref:uncharacterized protein n=1 Tax=Triticum aestivum TaxID=4565 RepID=UPI001D024F72|nr:uncharacterized protein LOC123067422 [Triticum aestivum]
MAKEEKRERLSWLSLDTHGACTSGSSLLTWQQRRRLQIFSSLGHLRHQRLQPGSWQQNIHAEYSLGTQLRRSALVSKTGQKDYLLCRTRALAATQGAGQRSTGQLLLELCCCWSTRISSCGSISLCINRGVLTSELRINFTLYQLQDQSGVAEVEPEASGVGGGDRRASAAEASPATTTSTSRRAKVDQHGDQRGGSERRSRGRSGPARRRSVVEAARRWAPEDPPVGGCRRTRSSVAGGGPARRWPAEILLLGGRRSPRGRAAEILLVGSGGLVRGWARRCLRNCGGWPWRLETAGRGDTGDGRREMGA